LSLSEQDAVFLERSIALAEKGLGRTSPNPLVGAVIVKDGRIIGEGFHAGPWRDHAEVDAIKDAVRRMGEERGDPGADEPTVGMAQTASASKVLAGTTMYVTLEPCCTYGRTPPCTSALIAAGLARAVVGAVDPSPDINGRGLELLRAAGIQVDLAEEELARRCKRQNNGLRKSVTTGLPFVTYKYAMTLDGRVATDTGDSRWISGPLSRELVHRWRAWSDAVMVGAGTLKRDDPRLTARDVDCPRQPLRVVIDPELAIITEGAALVQTAGEGPVLAVCGPEVALARRTEAEAWGVETAIARSDGAGGLLPDEVGRLLAARDVQTVLLEGGPRLAGSWWAAGRIDKVAAFVCPQVVSGWENRAPLLAEGAESIAEGVDLLEVEVEHMGSDVLISGYVREPF
jgi:diaminohydroxyphosphoribosylaminopyrimidine deaminase / 5-amino-6-(5-phosphoribosylamino)uracil reductase